MIIVHVQHYLNSDGREYFPVWLKEIAHVLSRFDGFIAVRQLKDVDNVSACHLLIEFENLEQLRAWSSSQDHDTMIAKIAPFRLRHWESHIYEAEERYEKVRQL